MKLNRGSLLAVTLLVLAPIAAWGSDLNLKEWRQAAAERSRRVIFNNDGCEVFLIRQPTREALLGARTLPLVGSQVDSLFYSTTQGFGVFTHFTEVGQRFTLREGRYGAGAINDNQLPALIAAGIDPLQVMIDFSRQQRLEIFCSFRMNDNHDGSTSDYGPVRFAANALKTAHPEYLLGSRGTRLPVGSWSAMNYGRTEVREHMFRYVEEVCRKYDVDGIELDFFRHPVFFQTTTRGEPATEEERSGMTELVQRIRRMADAIGRSRGRPILIAMRVPDSTDYARAIGLDLERWLREDLLDLMIASGYFQLNDWNYSVALARAHGVKVYPSLDEPRTKDSLARAERRRDRGYLGRGASAWQAGVDGIYMFNYFSDSNLKFELGGGVLRTIGDPARLAQADKDYFASVRGVGAAASGNHPLRDFQRIETLNPDAPRLVASGAESAARIQLGEDVSRESARLELALRFEGVVPLENIRVSINGNRLIAPRRAEPWIEFDVTADKVRPGSNQVSVRWDGQGAKSLRWLDLVLRARHSR